MARTVPAGLLGKYYAIRHSYGHYRSCAVSGTYVFSKEALEKTPDRFIQVLKYSLYHTIQRHPALCYGLLDKTHEAEAQFSILEIISWDDVVEIQSSNLPRDQQDAALSKHIGKSHEHLFKDQQHKPAWKIVVLRHESEASDSTVRVDVIYVNHHAIGDGTSGAAFQKTFLRFLHEAVTLSDLQVNWPYRVPLDLPPISYLEEACRFSPQNNTTPPSTNLLTTTSKINVWAASPPALDIFTSRVQTITIPSSSVTTILTYCRHLGITLTGLLHSLMVLYFSKAVPAARGFRAVTPYSMRRFTNFSDDEILNHISYISSDWREEIISSARTAAESSTEEEDVILKVTKQYQAEITDELENVPTRGPLALVDVSKIKDFDQYCRDGMTNKRGHTYEISNIGAVKVPEHPVGSEQSVELQKMTFTQSGMVAGPALGCSVISIRGKSLVVSLHWQEGILDDEFVNNVASYLERRLLAFGRTLVV